MIPTVGKWYFVRIWKSTIRTYAEKCMIAGEAESTFCDRYGDNWTYNNSECVLGEAPAPWVSSWWVLSWGFAVLSGPLTVLVLYLLGNLMGTGRIGIGPL